MQYFRSGTNYSNVHHNVHHNGCLSISLTNLKTDQCEKSNNRSDVIVLFSPWSEAEILMIIIIILCNLNSTVLWPIVIISAN